MNISDGPPDSSKRPPGLIIRGAGDAPSEADGGLGGPSVRLCILGNGTLGPKLW